MRRRSETSGQGTRPKAVQNKNTTKIKKIFPKQGCIFCSLTGYQVKGLLEKAKVERFDAEVKRPDREQDRRQCKKHPKTQEITYFKETF